MDTQQHRAWTETTQRFPEHSRKERKRIAALLRRRNFLRDYPKGSGSAAEAGALDWIVDRLQELEYEPVQQQPQESARN